ncbi:MAG: class I SAM-dependent methyltransferase [Ornithinimicrobium sp.]|uniref:class I SAM-dependent methyltransferase n=1 Tax=Ornithinimicrobium sp. TaxID=1977084 RepID=UPI003D9B6087
MTSLRPGSSSIEQPEYWWYRARSDLLRATLGEYVGRPTRLLDVGSADGPSVSWLHAAQHLSVDLDPRGLPSGEGVCASALSLPFVDECFDLVSAFDVIEHCESDSAALAEFSRVLVPGGRLLLSVPAYQWAWTDHDVRAGHHRRYTRPRLVRTVQEAGFCVRRASHAFAGVFPMFAAERVWRRVRRPTSGDNTLPQVSPALERLLLGLSRTEARLLPHRDLPFGSSVLLAADKPV